MMLKNVWKIAAGDEAQWIKEVAAKYFSASSFWHTTRYYQCSNFWRSLLQNRSIMAANIKWILGDGKICRAYNQPWFNDWSLLNIPKNQQKFDRVENLFNRDLLNWDFQSLVEFAGPAIATRILAEHSETTLQEGLQDKLIFTWARNGEFSVKQAYHMVSQLTPNYTAILSNEEQQTWKRIWKSKGITPRVKIFFWKCMHNALPTGAALTKRIHSITPACKICNAPSEDIVHALFLCDHARAVWYMSLGLRTDITRMNFKHILHLLWNGLDASKLAQFLSIAWHIWKARCSALFADKPCQPCKVVAESHNLIQMCNNGIGIRMLVTGKEQIQKSSCSEGILCWVDGSFDNSDQGGAAHIVISNSELLWYQVSYLSNPISPFQVEAEALLRAVQAVHSRQIEECTFLSDCQLLVKIFQGTKTLKGAQVVDWRSYHSAKDCLAIK